MTRRISWHRSYWGLAPLCLAAALFAPSSARAISSAGCDNRVNDTPAQAGRVHPDGRSLEAHAGVPGDRRRQSGPATAIRRATPASRATRRPPTTSRRRCAGRIRRHDPDVHVHLLRRTSARRRSARPRRPRTTSRWSRDWNPGQQHGHRDGRQSSRPAASSCRRRRRRARRAAAPRPTSAASPGKIALIQRGTCNFGVKVLNARAAGASAWSSSTRATRAAPRVFCGSMVDARRQPVRRDHPGRVHVVRHRPEPVQRVHGRTPPLTEPEHPRDRRPEPRRLQRHRGVQGRRPEPRRGRRRAPRRDLRRRHARQRLRLGDDPRHRPEDAERPSAEQAAVHLVRRRGARPPGLQVLRQQPRRDRAEPHRLRPRRRRHGDAELLIGVLDPAAVGPLRPHGHRRRSRTRSTSRRRSRATRRSRTSTRSGRTTSFFSPIGTDAFSFNVAGDPGQRSADRAGLLQDPGRGRPVRRLPRQLRGQRRRASTAAASTTRSAGATTSSNNDPAVLTFMSKAFADMVVQMAFDTSVMWQNGAPRHAPKVSGAVERRAAGRRPVGTATGERGAGESVSPAPRLRSRGTSHPNTTDGARHACPRRCKAGVRGR